MAACAGTASPLKKKSSSSYLSSFAFCHSPSASVQLRAMSSQTADRPVLRPAGNIEVRAPQPSTAIRKASKLSKTSPPTSPSKPSAKSHTRTSLTHCISKAAPPLLLDSSFAKAAETISERLVPNFNIADEISMSKAPITKNASKVSHPKSIPPGDLIQKTSNKVQARYKTGVMSKMGSLCDELSLGSISDARKSAAINLQAQKKLRIAEYGRVKRATSNKIAPEVLNLAPIPVELKRCKFITAQSDPIHIAYHDDEWGVPVHDDRLLFELLVLVGAQVELSWPTILSKRAAYRAAFAGFEPSVVARLSNKQIANLEADTNLMLHSAKIRGIVENAKRILEIIEEYGSLKSYMWGFVNGRPMVNKYKYARQVPVKTSKSEGMSKELVGRGFRFVGPTIMYSFMQAAGLCNDHLTECFRHHQCSTEQDD